MSQYDTQSTSSAGTIASLEELEKTPEGKRQRWMQELDYSEKELKDFHTQARRTLRKYLDNRDAIDTEKKWFNIFNTNVGIIKSSLYANIPQIEISRRFSDMNDDVARVAGTILQRSVEQDLTKPHNDFDTMMRQVVADRLIPGLGTAWVRLETETEDQPPIRDENGGLTCPTDEEGNPLQRISHQEVCIDYVYWEDFLWSPCRVWGERRWVGRKVPMTRDALAKRFGEEKAKNIALDYQPKEANKSDQPTPANMVMKRACIYEIWDRETRKVFWLSRGYPDILDEKDDPLGLEDFEPCPEPLFANLTTSNCRPKPDYAMLQDQYIELDETNNRISLLIVACKVVGVYDRGSEGIQRMLTEGYDNTLIPVDNWAMFAEKGGVKGSVDWLPLDVVVQALGQLQAHREAIKAQIYELTGISDIVRGASKASETLGAQDLKAKFASVRIQTLQDEVARFGEDVLRIKSEILVKHFEPLRLVQMSNILNTPDAQFVQPAVELLFGPEESFEWRVKIQNDSMAQTDFERQKVERSEFMNAVATFLQSSASVGQGAPQLIPLMLELLKFGVAGFRVSKDVESIFDKYIDEFNQELEAKKNAPPQPDPEQQKAQAEMAMKQQEAQLKQQSEQQRMQMDAQKQQLDMQMAERKAQQELQQMQAEFALKLHQMQQEFALKMEQMEREANLKVQVAAQDAAAKSAMQQDKHALSMEQQAEKEAAKPEKKDD